MQFIQSTAMQPGYMPPQFEPYRIPIAEVCTYSTPGLTVVSQRIPLKNYDVNLHIFDSESRRVIKPKAGRDILTIHYMLQGNIDALLRRGMRVELKYQEYNIFQLPGQSHYATLEKGIYWCFHIDLHQELQDQLRKMFMFDFFQQSYQQTGGIINLRPMKIQGRENILIRKVLDYRKTGPTATQELEKIIDDLFLLSINKYSSDLNTYFSGEKVSDQQLANVIALIHSLNTKLPYTHNMEAIAIENSIEPADLDNIFTDLFGKSFSKYYSDQRLARVYTMLATGSLGVVDIAAAMGYRSLSDLEEAFKNEFGITMTQAREDFLKQDD